MRVSSSLTQLYRPLILSIYRNNCGFKAVPPGLANLVNLEILNLFNNHITELPISLSQMPKLRILNVGSVDFIERVLCLISRRKFIKVFYFRQNESVRHSSSRLWRVSGPRGVGLDIQQSQRKEPARKFFHDGSVTVVKSSNALLHENPRINLLFL